ncbi:MAG: D-glycero-beta-D-manno-heptose 1-phosphate adenylyltransferase [bacterium]
MPLVVKLFPILFNRVLRWSKAKRMGRIVTRQELSEICRLLKREGKHIVFTNGCFDILHRGHVEYLTKARSLGDLLVVGMNTDASVQRLKGPSRPIVSEMDRAYVLSALAVIDYVCLFDEDTPYELIKAIVPDILVKGGDWSIDAIVGKDVVEQAGGAVHSITFESNRSTSQIVEKIRESNTK